MPLDSCQTVLTLPPVLPKELEDALKPYFTYNSDQQQVCPSEASLFRKLFDNELDSSEIHSCTPEPDPPLSPISPPRLTPTNKGHVSERAQDGTRGIFDEECELSPIKLNSRPSKLECSIRSNSSANVVPNTDELSFSCSWKFGKELLRVFIIA